MAARRFNQFFNTLHQKPVLLDCNFTVDATAAAGTTLLKGAGIQNVWMHSSSPSAANPNPASGYAVIQFQDNYKSYFMGGFQMHGPNTGSNLLIASAGLTVGQVYVISVLGTTSAAQWIVLGVPRGIVPAVGVAFVAQATSATGTGAVQLAAASGSGILDIDIIGVAGTTLNSLAAQVSGISSGSYMILRFLAATNSSTTTLIATAPAAGTKVRMSFYMTDSNILVQGE